jgi:WD40 repeat protein
MRFPSWSRCVALVALGWLAPAATSRADESAALARKAEAVLKANCFRCHGKDGSLEGGMNYILDRDKLVARKKVLPGKADDSPLIKKVVAGKMPPAGEQPRPSEDDVRVLKEWINAGAPPAAPAGERPVVTEAAVFELILADLDKQEKRSRRFLRYFSLAPLANAGQTADELQSYRNALAKLMNSLSWHPKITLPKAIDEQGLVMRIDLREFMWDANLWNRLVADYPYGVLTDTAVSRAVIVATGTRLPYVRLDWFVANASRAPLYYDLLQLPTNLSELERQLRVDVALDVQQERVARAGFLGSGISRNNRLIERHDSVHGAYWRTYDFEAIPQNLTDRDILLPDRRNLFAYPLGPGGTENTFQHAAGEAIFNLPNGLQGYILVNANNVRQNKGATAIVSDPKRPDRAVEAGVSCMNCHATGILQKADQIRAHVAKNPKAFSRADAEVIRALYVPDEKMKRLMDEDAQRFKKAVEKTGNKIGSAEVVMTMTLQYESDVDLPTLAAEAGVKPNDLLARLQKSEVLAKNLGSLKVSGGQVARQVVVQAFGDVVRELRLGSPIQPGSLIQNLPDNTGEIDPLEAQSSPANAIAFSRDGRYAAIASADKTVRIWDVDAGRELRRCVGHTASVWAVAFSPDGTRILSGGKDNSVRLWDADTGREVKKLEGHTDMVTAVAFAPDGRRALSTGYDNDAILWDLEKFQQIESFKLKGVTPRYMNAAVFSPDGDHVLICAEKTMHLVNAKSGELVRSFVGHGSAVVSAVFSADSKQILSGSDDRTMRLWDVETGKQVQAFNGHENSVKCVAFAPDGKRVLSGSTDATVRLWDIDAAKELKVFRKHAEPLVAVTFIEKGRQTLSGSRDAIILPWVLEKSTTTNPNPNPDPNIVGPNPVRPAVPATDLRPSAVIPVGGTVGALYLSPDRQWLFYLNVTEAKLGKVNMKTARREKELKLADGTDVLARTPDGKTLIATAPAKDGCTIQVIDPKTLEVRKSFWVDVAAYDVAANDAGLIFLSGGKGEWTDIAVVDSAKEAVVARWGGVWNRSFVQLSADQKRLYYSSQGVSPGTLDALLIPQKLDDKPATYRAAFPGRQPLGGEFQLTSDGRYLLCKTGTVLRLSPTRDDDLKFHVSLDPFAAAAVDAESRAAFVLTRDGTLDQYSYPDFRLKTSHRIGVTAFQAVCDGAAGKLYVAGLDPRTVAERPRAKGFGEIYVYETKDLQPATKSASK